ncbi:MAG TPA: FHA domain-containing protein [Myxococcota bacterium]|jgi:hypothetical protein|nr:FHA domain-containing protein [Myxococcota bacterium]HQC43791.1 FHA domain-containing protein [Myxococcota bacterium]
MAKILFEDDLGNSHLVPFDKAEITVGRATDNDVVLPDRNISRHHLSVRKENKHFVVSPVKARYGVEFEGKLVKHDLEFAIGESLKVGDYVVTFMEVDEQVVESRKPTVKNEPVFDLETAIREGRVSDFYEEDEKKIVRDNIIRLVVAVVLLVVAVGLGIFFYKGFVADPEWDLPTKPEQHAVPVVQPEPQNEVPTN